MINLHKAIIPMPKEINQGKKEIKVASFGKMPNILGEGIAAKTIKDKLYSLLASEECGNYTISFKIDKDNSKFGGREEAYLIAVSDIGTVLCGSDEAGLFYAAQTLCQMFYEVGDDLYLPECEIVDFPDFKYRGQFMECRYGSEFMTRQDYFDMIDYMVSMKSNQLTIGVYGCWSVQYDDRKMQYLYIPIKKYPELKTYKNIKYYSARDKKWVHKDNLLPTMFEEDFLSDVIAYGKERHMTVKPLFNSLGHNTLIPEVFPEICAKDENGNPSGFGFCTNNEKTYEVMFSIYDEIIERYLKPNGIVDIHIGLDEVGKPYICHCEKCEGKEHSYLMTEYIIKLCKYLKAKGMKRIYIYHDMLYHEFNIVNEELRDRFKKEGIYDEVVLDWWTYEDPKHLFWDKAEGVNNLFHSVIKPDTGYYHWTLPTENNENIRACVKMAKGLGFEGVESYSSYEKCYDKNYLTLADVSWNSDNVDNMAEFDERYAYRHFRDNVNGAVDAFRLLFDIMRDETGEMYMNRACYKLDYYFYCYRREGKIHNFPGEAYKLISENEETFVNYLDFLKTKATAALQYFENCGQSSEICDIWRLTAKQYVTLADEYLTLYGLNKAYDKGEVTPLHVLAELGRLLKNREEIMLLAENTRIPATSYTYLRNMSVFRQYILDLKIYFEKEINEGRRPKLDMLDLQYATGEKFKFLQ